MRVTLPRLGAIAVVLCFSLPATGQDAGDLDKARLEKVLPSKPAYSP